MSFIQEINFRQVAYRDGFDNYDADPVIVEGVISPEGYGGGGFGEVYDTHIIKFSAWKLDGGNVTEKKLIILRGVSPGNIREHANEFPMYSIQKFSVLLSTNNDRAVFEKVLPIDNLNGKLKEIAEELQQEVFFSTEKFGDLLQDKRLSGWYETCVEWHGKKIQLVFDSDGEEVGNTYTETAEFFWNDLDMWNSKAKQYAAKELLESANGGWYVEEDENGNEIVLTETSFMELMTLSSILIKPDKRVLFYYNDGGIFCDHGICVVGNMNEGIIAAEMG